MTMQRAEGTFDVESFNEVELPPAAVVTEFRTGVAILAKQYSGEVDGTSETLFVGAQDTEGAAGSYVALESFIGTLHGKFGAFNFIHVASTHGTDRYDEMFSIVDFSGNRELTGISGGGGLAIDPDGTHRIWFEYQLP